MSYDIIGMGELLVDFTPVASRTYQANPGGGPPNMLAAAASFGMKTGFMGMVGDDQFGEMLINDLKNVGIDTAGVKKTNESSTTLAFVHLTDEGERSFSFVRQPGSDTLYGESDIDYEIIDQARIFHFSSVSMSHDPARKSNLLSAAYAKSKGISVCYDPNLRTSLWESIHEARAVMSQCLEFADIVKMSEEELEFITGEKDWDIGINQVMEKGVNILLITLGSQGCMYAHQDFRGTVPGYKVNVVDTTGAGDAFTGGILTAILKSGKTPKDKFQQKDLENLVRFANASGAMATTKKGGVSGMPILEEVMNCIKNEK